eukprot:TRINITY_DN26251_c0_g1_i2.p1 TRINITY_DN26251_c0_g1~~TRINITY_DN26251_c0_g1_i2.p1  ORF type:complete len:369 (-),score=97.08 TRINITY_DN26251_c0_g1_i2:46-1092(-)
MSYFTWKVEQSFRVAGEHDDDESYREKADLLKHVTSVAEAVDHLNAKRIDGGDGIFLVHSTSQKAYYCIYRIDMTEAAHELFNKEMTEEQQDALAEKAKVKRPHQLQKKSFIIPTWCDICSGILVGGGYECSFCGLRCHAGLGGPGAENCRADLLCKPCEKGCEHVIGTYKFGDITKQLARNVHQNVKDTVVSEIVKEQRGFGKFDRLKEQMAALRDAWDDNKVIGGVLLVQLASVALTMLFTYMLVFALRLSLSLANLQASLLVASLLLHWTVLFLVVHLLARGMIRYSALVHTFVLTILQIDLEEMEINLDDAGHALVRTSRVVLIASTTAWVAAAGVWMRLVRAA